MLKKLWLSLPLSMICMFAQAQTVTTASSTPTNTLAPAKSGTTMSKSSVTAAPTAGTSTTEVKKEEDPKVKFGMSIAGSYGTQVQKQADGTRKESITYEFTPSIAYDKYTFMIYTAYEQDLKDTGSNGSFLDPSYILSRAGWTLNDYFKLSPGAVLVLPVSDDAKNNRNLLYSVTGNLTLGLQTKALGLDALSVSYMLGYTGNNTQFSTTAAGEPLTAYRIRNRLNVGYKFTDKFSLATRFQMDSNYSAVEAGVVKNSFLHFQSFAYALTDNLEISAGHSNDGSLLKGPDYKNNLKFFDEESSSYSVGLELSL
jgi:hypothetical protein